MENLGKCNSSFLPGPLRRARGENRGQGQVRAVQGRTLLGGSLGESWTPPNTSCSKCSGSQAPFGLTMPFPAIWEHLL